jgi:hypothetical protein
MSSYVQGKNIKQIIYFFVIIEKFQTQKNVWQEVASLRIEAIAQTIAQIRLARLLPPNWERGVEASKKFSISPLL